MKLDAGYSLFASKSLLLEVCVQVWWTTEHGHRAVGESENLLVVLTFRPEE
jgi:hypothetical protein